MLREHGTPVMRDSNYAGKSAVLDRRFFPSTSHAYPAVGVIDFGPRRKSRGFSPVARRTLREK